MSMGTGKDVKEQAALPEEGLKDFKITAEKAAFAEGLAENHKLREHKNQAEQAELSGQMQEEKAPESEPEEASAAQQEADSEQGEPEQQEDAKKAPKVQQEADVGVTKTSDPQRVKPGETLDYHIEITNYGPSPAEEVEFTDIVPDAFLDPEISDDGGMFFNPWPGQGSIGLLQPGESRSFIIRGIVRSDAVLPLVNTVNVTAQTFDPNPDNNQARVVTEIDSKRAQALTDVIQSVALMETAISHILNAEGEKMQRMMSLDGVTSGQLLELNESVKQTAGAAARLSAVLQAKLRNVIE